MTQEALKLALDALETELSIDWTNNDEFNASAEKMYEAIAAIKEALAKEKTLQALHSENERLGLYKDAYAQPEQEPVRHKLITLHETHKNFVPIGSIELKLVVARAEGCKIKLQQTRYHHVVDGTTVTSVDEYKPTYYYYDDAPLPCFDPYLVAMEFYLKEKGITNSDFIKPKEKNRA